MTQTELKLPKITQKKRVENFIRSMGGISDSWAIERWAVNTPGISAGSALRRCREMVADKNPTLFHPKINDIVDETKWQIVREKLRG
jgi:hypothetical protein